MTFTLHAAIESARRVEEARKRSLAAVHGQETRRDMSAAPPPLRNYDRERQKLRRQQTMQERYGQQHGSDANSGSIRIRMVISDWSRDEFGNLTRTIQAAE